MWESPAGLAVEHHLLKNISSEWPGQVQPVLFKAQLYALHLGKVTAERNLYWTVTAGGGTPCNSGRAVKRPIPAARPEVSGRWCSQPLRTRPVRFRLSISFYLLKHTCN